MLYRKNVGRAESIARLVGGLALMAAAWLWRDFDATGLVLAAAGLAGIATALFGYCPACALIGRKPLP